MTEAENWEQCDMHVFWGEVAPCNHLVQIYESDDIVLDSLQGFVSSGFKTGESVVLIATPAHLIALEQRLQNIGFTLSSFIANDQYIALDVHEVLDKFMVNNWPDQQKFEEVVSAIIKKAKGNSNRPVRAYGEMVAILWGQKLNDATVQLEQLWNKFCEKEVFCLFCAYPKSVFTKNREESIAHICTAHTKVINGFTPNLREVYYRSA